MPVSNKSKEPPSLATLSLSSSSPSKPSKSNPSHPRKTITPPLSPAPPPDSWEEEADGYGTPPSSSTSSDEDSPTSSPNQRSAKEGRGNRRGAKEGEVPDAPPPTPISPPHRFNKPSFPSPSQAQAEWENPYGAAFTSSPSTSSPKSSIRNKDGSERRPEKSTAAASRMIAAGLGVRKPRDSEEGRAYERAVREKERRRVEGERDARKREEREREEAKRGVWEG